jgi:hypothetical protein
MDKDSTTRRIERESSAERLRDKDDRARASMKDAIKEAMKDSGTHKNIAQELLDSRRGGTTMKNRESFGDDGEIITGKDRPWERD